MEFLILSLIAGSIFLIYGFSRLHVHRLAKIESMEEADQELVDEALGDNVNICIKCHHHRNHSGKDIWYNHLCNRNRTPKEIDPVTGKEIGGDPKYCREVNPEGSCPDFKPKIIQR